MYISPINAYTSVNNAKYCNKKTTDIKNNNVAFQHKEEIFVSTSSLKILENLFHALHKAKHDLGETKVLTKGFEVTHKYPHNMNTNMRKYNPDEDMLIRLDESVNGTALQVHIDKFRQEEFIRFMVQMKDIRDAQGNLHLKKGHLNDFRWNYNFYDKSDEKVDIDNIIETYLNN